ncbi:HK97 gp10 family phage protein [Bacillus sp. CGMCC 1.16541]|uniref:HK97 gp10 family phage protein n=1 Tax=Bacillus sp. CGMCC 1.16541 TaxID=2185143 RepID=UPI000D73509D|nr:HK97 gp10 family phage protein [Bacillus sp. CGMCC 1.16541]
MEDGFRITGLDELTRRLIDIVTRDYPLHARAWAEALAMRYMELVAELAPVDTARLKNSILSAAAASPNSDAVFETSASGGDVSVIVGTNVEYAEHVEYGHATRGNAGIGEEAGKEAGVWVDGFHFFADAWDTFEPEAKQWLQDRIEELFAI